MAVTLVARVVVALEIPTKVSDLLLYVKSIHKSMNNNPNFSNSSNRLNTLNTDIATLDTIQTGLGVKPPLYTVAARDVALEVVKTDLRLLGNDVQSVADQAPTKAEAIVLSSGMKIKKSSTRDKRQNTVSDGNLQGMVELTAEGKGAHQWQQSNDGGATIIHLDPTLGGVTMVTGLTPGEKVWFRNRLILAGNTYGEWCDWISITPKTF